MLSSIHPRYRYAINEDDGGIEVNPEMLKRVLDLQTLSEDDKDTALKLLDAFLRDAKTKQAYAS